jgi:hypothetical protein
MHYEVFLDHSVDAVVAEDQIKLASSGASDLVQLESHMLLPLPWLVHLSLLLIGSNVIVIEAFREFELLEDPSGVPVAANNHTVILIFSMDERQSVQEDLCFDKLG